MNREHKYELASDNQLRTLSHIGMFQKELPKPPSALASYPDPLHPTADLATRAKTYLHVNCSMCHVSDGGGNSMIELGYKTPLDKSRMLNEPPMHETFGIANALLVAPGDSARSVLHHRMNIRGTGQMPPTSSNRVDEAGAALLRDWINKLPPR
ncbi:MAG: hypothetical protein JNL62_22340 [Bryobacterales bacterium]|nr:hypothetical protein [Bryobacterales bacterium]